MTADRVYNVLFLCTGNSARSILAESILNAEGKGRFRAFSAGSHPKGQVHPWALKTLDALGYPATGFSSKSWDVFAETDAPQMDFIFTVCDNPAGEACPVWLGHPMTAHWGVEDPAAVGGSDVDVGRAFALAARYLKNRIMLFVNLPITSIDKLALETELRQIGATEGATSLALLPIAGHEAELRSALAAADLPTDDLDEAGRRFFRIARGVDTVGFGGYELHGDSALLRSVVITPANRHKGLGRRATDLLLRRAYADGARTGYLLTTTAAPFFETLGFKPIDRASAPAAILQTRQAASLCPASAALLAKPLQG
jgi:protein-tyrosine-phosphatase/N-acetylglutamate synthase-like GNAT family acetyltransferase